MPCSSLIISEMALEIHTMKKCDFLKSILHFIQFNSLLSLLNMYLASIESFFKIHCKKANAITCYYNCSDKIIVFIYIFNNYFSGILPFRDENLHTHH